MKACINYISSRSRCIKQSLQSLWDNYNKDYNYPVYVYYFDDIYDSEVFRNEVRLQINENIHFVSVPYKTPSFLKEEELYYNRSDINYVQRSFSIQRKGYLHMCNFKSNMYGYLNTHFHKYNCVMMHDDEAGYTRPLAVDPFEIMSSRPEVMGAFFVGQRLKNGAPHQGHYDTRLGLWEFTRNFLLTNNITPASPQLQELLESPTAERDFHLLEWCDTYVIKTEMFKSDLWKKWIAAVNENGGIYKYRWGDNEIITLFAYIYDGNIFDLGLVEDETLDQGMFRHMQDIAPSIKDIQR